MGIILSSSFYSHLRIYQIHLCWGSLCRSLNYSSMIYSFFCSNRGSLIAFRKWERPPVLAEGLTQLAIQCIQYLTIRDVQICLYSASSSTSEESLWLPARDESNTSTWYNFVGWDDRIASVARVTAIRSSTALWYKVDVNSAFAVKILRWSYCRSTA